MFGVAVVDGPSSQRPVRNFLLKISCVVSVDNTMANPFRRLRTETTKVKSPKNDWSSLLSATNLVDDYGQKTWFTKLLRILQDMWSLISCAV